MIHSIPNPPMDREDIARFRNNLTKHLRGELTADERHQLELNQLRSEVNVKKIIKNCGGINPILGY